MIKILYEDNDIIVIDKPSGVTVNRAETTKGEETVQDWAEIKLKIESGKLKVEQGSDFYSRGGIVHRLDKETSGILLIAKNPEAFAELQRQFKERLVKKTYLALVHGAVVPETGTIQVPVGRLPWNRKQFGVVAGGREAVTDYKVLRYLPEKAGNDTKKTTLLECYPQTGRTHQIRVHLKYIGYPIFGDYLYAGRKTQRTDRKKLSRVFLHAFKLSFHHPATGIRMEYESPIPDDLATFLSENS